MVLAEDARFCLRIRTLLLAIILFGSTARADSVALILMGIPGSPEHGEKFDRWTTTTRGLLVDTFGFAPADVTVLTNREARADDIRAAFDAIGQRAGPADTLFVFFIGHGSYDSGEYKFLISGPDMTGSDYSELVAAVGAGRSVIINATNSSGAILDTLAGPNRVVVTATRSGSERNDTYFYDYFLEALGTETSDEDKNEKISVWEAFRYATLAVERFFTEETRLASEHPQLSDNGGEKGGVEPEETPVLARMIDFNVDAVIQTDDPVLAGLLEKRRQLEAEIGALRLVEDTMPAEEYDRLLEELLIELALTGRQIREREGP